MPDYALLPFKEAIAYLKNKIALDSTAWNNFTDDEIAAIFAVAGMKGQMLADVHELVIRSQEQGWGQEEFKQRFEQVTANWTAPNKDWRSQIIFQTNMRVAYGRGRAQRQLDPEVLKVQPYLQYVHGDTRVPRPHHRALDGKVFKATEVPWHNPNGFGCQCKYISLSDRQVRNRGLEVSDLKRGDTINGVKLEPEKGWDYDPLKGNTTEERMKILDGAIARMPSWLQAQVRADVAQQLGALGIAFSEFENLTVHFAPTSTAPKKKNCTKGVYCIGKTGKGSCVKAGSKCRRSAAQGSKDYTEAIGPQPDKKIASANTSLPDDPWGDNPDRETTDFAQSWSSAWQSAPDDLKKLIAHVDEPGEIDYTPDKTAHYNGLIRSIHMAEYTIDGAGRDIAVYRHEYGHHLDNELLTIKANRDIDKVFRKYGYQNKSDWEKQNETQNDWGTYEKVLNDLGESSFFAYRNQLADRYFSSTEPFKTAIAADRDRLLALSKNHSDRDRAELREEPVPYSGTNKARVDKYVKELQSVRDYNQKLLSDRQSEADDFLNNSGDLVARVYREAPDRFNEVERRKLYTTAGDPVALARATEKVLRADGLVEDLIASATKNRVGLGHEDGYYKNKGSAETEVFANLVAIHAVNTNVTRDVLEALTPSSYRQFKEALNGKL